MEITPNSSYQNLDKEASRVFLFFSFVIYSIAFIYCYITESTTGMLFVAIGAAIITATVIMLFGMKENKIQ